MKKVIVDKSYKFALNSITLYRDLVQNKKEFVLSKQLLRSSTSIGANVEEGQSAISKKDFVSKNSIALKEARETNYCLRLLKDSKLLDSKFKYLIDDSLELKKILTAIVKTSQQSLKK